MAVVGFVSQHITLIILLVRIVMRLTSFIIDDKLMIARMNIARVVMMRSQITVMIAIIIIILIVVANVMRDQI